MRLRRLDLKRYGHFSGFTLDFGAADRECDLHIIYGPNESGKSTAFDAYLDLLYGIPSRSPYNFLHDYENMAIGGALDLDGGTVELLRVKKTKNDLLGSDGQPINPAILQNALKGIDREQYRSMFSLDDETIEAGGDDILASRGSLGELLFSAAAGLSDLGEVLETARAEVDAFHKPRARKTRLQDAKKRLDELKREIRELDVQASAYRTLRSERDTAAERHANAKSARDGLIEKRSRMDALLECLPLLLKRDELHADLASRPGLPEIPEAWESEARDLDVRRIAAETEKRTAAARRAGLEKKRAELEQDPEVLSVGEELTRLLDRPRTRAQGADDDLPRRRDELSGLEREIAGFARDLGFDDPDALVLSEMDLERLDVLEEEWSKAENALDGAKREKERAREHLAKLKQDGGGDSAHHAEDEVLGPLLEQLDPEIRLAEVKSAEEAIEEAGERLDEALRDLRPADLSPHHLDAVSFSPEEASRLAAAWDDLQDGLETLEKQLLDAEVMAAQAAARLKAAKEDERLSVEREELDTRKKRDAAWERHRDTLSLETAESFHEWLVRNDGLQDARLGVAEQIAQVRELERASSEAEAKRQTLAAQLKDKQARVASLRTEMGETLALSHLPESYDPRDLPSWCERLRRAQSAWRDLERKRAHREDVLETLLAVEASLREALHTEGPQADFALLVRAARKRAGEAAEIAAAKRSRQQALERAVSDLRERHDIVEASLGDLERVTDAWDATASRVPLEVSGPRDLKAFLPTLRKLLGRRNDRAKLRQRIDAMEHDLEDFSRSIRDLAVRLGVDAKDPALLISDQLKRRLDDAISARDRDQALAEEIGEEEERIATADVTLTEIERLTGQRAQTFAESWEVKSTSDLVEAISAAKVVRGLRHSIDELEQRITTRLGVATFEGALAELADQSLIDVQASRDALEQDISEAEAHYTEVIGDLRAAEDALSSVGGDDRVARLEEEKQVLLLDLADHARAIAELRAGLLAAEAAIAKYREVHRSRMLADTARAFRSLTNGAYSDLGTQIDGSTETLLALRQKDNRSVTATDMSKGTRFQLYLALRLAGYRQFSEGGATLPFVADDIMETFDNSRTRAALLLLQEIAREGQALYFTHHEHVVDLARDVCGSAVVVHALEHRTTSSAA